MINEDVIKEMEQRVIERAKFWDDYINLLLCLRNEGVRAAYRVSEYKYSQAERLLHDGLQQAIEAALLLQKEELAECFMIAGVGGELAMKYAQERARRILGEDALEFAATMGWVPTYWCGK